MNVLLVCNGCMHNKDNNLLDKFMVAYQVADGVIFQAQRCSQQQQSYSPDWLVKHIYLC